MKANPIISTELIVKLHSPGHLPPTLEPGSGLYSTGLMRYKHMAAFQGEVTYDGNSR